MSVLTGVLCVCVCSCAHVCVCAVCVCVCVPQCSSHSRVTGVWSNLILGKSEDVQVVHFYGEQSNSMCWEGITSFAYYCCSLAAK